MSKTTLTGQIKNLKEVKNKLEKDIKGLEALVGCTDSSLMLIPGKEIPLKSKNSDLIQKVYYTAKKEVNQPNFDFKKFNSSVLLTPIVVSTFDSDTNFILVNTVTFINAQQDPKHFNLFFNYTLNDNGEPQLSIYICYVANEIPAKTYIIKPFMIYFSSNSVKNGSKQIIPLNRIKAIKVFLVNRDPRTSRGTMTTVQHQNDTGN